jgi:hypothetical protein
MKVKVYFNLHKKVFSIQDYATRRVIAHARNVTLTDVEFRVSQAGRERVVREKRKNVHAFAVGNIQFHSDVVICDDDLASMTKLTDIEATYNPYKYDSFVDKATEQKVYGAQAAYLFGRRIFCTLKKRIS